MASFDQNAALASLEALLRADLDSGDGWTAVSCSVPAGRARALLDAQLTHESSYFCSGDGSSTGGNTGDGDSTYVGVGSLASGRFEGASRFADAEAFITRTFAAGCVQENLADHVRFFGGAAFAPGRDGGGNCWSEFGDARFVLPRCLYVDGSVAKLIVLSRPGEEKTSLKLAREVLTNLVAAPQRQDVALSALSRKESEEPRSWREMIEAIKKEIHGGAVEKIVAARRITLQLNAAPESSGILDRLNSQAPRCARFALRVGEKTFIGATPERLIRKVARQVETEALAGSISADLEGGAQALLESDKNCREHALVVDAIRASLGPWCEELSIPVRPSIRRLRTILHLRTPISGRLRGDQHILRLVSQLHPTPAVGGLPSDPAVAFIGQHERAERGWYAAPVGWVNCRGDGEFVVALRSGLIAGDKVHLYAGAGIVAGSDSDEEFEETELKLTGMLGALGLNEIPVTAAAKGVVRGRPES